MADKTGVVLDQSQVKKAVQALQAFMKSKSTGDSLFLDDSQHISLLFTMWRIPKVAQTIRIPLPHGQRSDTEEICLFTRDEPKMTPEQTQRFYKRLLEEKGIKNISEIIPFKVLKTEYKPFEAKRRLLGNFDLFLSDDRVRRLLPSHLGKHFYERKKEPLCVNLQSKHLARDIQSIIQGTKLKVNNKGCCCMARVAHSNMSADEVTENIKAAVKTVTAKLRLKGPMIKLLHIKSQTSVALPIYTADISQIKVLQTTNKKPQAPKKKEGAAKKKPNNKETGDAEQTDATAEETKLEKEEDEEEIPQLVPIETPSKKPKLQKPMKKKKQQQLKKAPKPNAVKKGANKTANKPKPTQKKAAAAGMSESTVKRKVAKKK